MRIDKNTTIRLGDRNIIKIKIGDSVIWEKKTVVDETDYFYIESLGDGNTVSVINKGDGSTTNVTPTLEYSTDKKTWNTITFDWTSGEHTTELPILNTGDKVYFRNDTHLFSNSNSKYISFSSSVSSNVGGDIRTLSNYLDVDNETKPQTGMFRYLFYNNKNIVDASNLRLSYTTIEEYCYNSMFKGCTSLTSAPTELPATTLKMYCYSNMFSGCTKLNTALELPATTLDLGCYNSMFYGCASLTSAPALPATTLKMYCYNSMFYGCTKLTTAPELPATTLKQYCYSSMFRGCTKLTSAPELPVRVVAVSCCSSMFYGCTSLTTAPTELPATTLANSCYSSMFKGCNKLTTAPELPATTLVKYCYSSMFNGCSSLVNAPELSATTLASNCYESIFERCSKLKSVTIYATKTATNAFNDWLDSVPSGGTIYNNGFIQLPTNSISGIPSGWTEVTPPIESITANPDTFTIKSYTTIVTCKSTLTITTTTGTTVTQTNSATITVSENTGDTTRTIVETIPYKGSSYQVTIVQTSNDVRPPMSWNVVSEGTYPFQLNTNGYYESTNKGISNSYSYATLNYSGFENLVLECINSSSSNYDYGIISQPDVQLSKSTTDDGESGSTKVFKNFKGESSTNPVQIVIPSDEGSHFITIKYRRYVFSSSGNDSLQFKVIEPTT